MLDALFSIADLTHFEASVAQQFLQLLIWRVESFIPTRSRVRSILCASAQTAGTDQASTRAGFEPELALAIDPLVLTAPLIASIRMLNDTFPS